MNFNKPIDICREKYIKSVFKNKFFQRQPMSNYVSVNTPELEIACVLRHIERNLDAFVYSSTMLRMTKSNI